MATVDIPISAAKKVALDYGYDQVIIIGRKCGQGGREHCTTFSARVQFPIATLRLLVDVNRRLLDFLPPPTP